METRKCKRCEITYDLTDTNWYIRKETGTITTHVCKECVKKAAKLCRENQVATDREGYNKAAWSRRIKRTYGVSLEEYTKTIEEAGCCAICKKIPSGKFSDNLVYDHCHVTGKFRGVICNKCNVGIGALGDTAEAVLAGYEYLKEFEEREPE